jgi:hypothetical protein
MREKKLTAAAAVRMLLVVMALRVSPAVNQQQD